MGGKLMYRVYYLNQYCAMFDTRDAAIHYIEREVILFGENREDYEILDESDN